MKRTVLVSSLVLLLAAVPAAADGKKAKKHGHGDMSQFCPPGLAKKNPPCVPPGLAKTQRFDRDDDHGHVYRVGDIIRDRYIILRDPLTYGLDPNGTYWRVGDNLFRVDGETGRVLAALGLINALLN